MQLRTPFVVIGDGPVYLGRVRRLLGVADRVLDGVGDRLGVAPVGMGCARSLLAYRLLALGSRYTRFGNAGMLLGYVRVMLGKD